MMNRFILAIARLEPSGLAPFAPGTFGSLFSLILAYFLFLPFPLYARAFSLLALFVLGVWVSNRGAEILGTKDPSEIVIDELVGLWIVLLPFSLPQNTGEYYIKMLVAFALFRFFDILKPYPIKKLEMLCPKYPGLGIMIDDVMAGIYALICFALFSYLYRFFA